MDDVPFVRCATCTFWSTPFGMKSHLRKNKGHKAMRLKRVREIFPFAKGVA